jgi:superfamily II DNA/RNA helicase
MSATTASSVSVVLSDKFKKELEKFLSWASESYTIKDINNNEKEWSVALLTKFEEPGRNKLEAYIKSLLQTYIISIGEMDIEDAKLLAKEFKEKSGKSKKSEASESSEKETKTKETKTKKTSEKPKKEVKEKETKTTKKSKSVSEPSVRLDMSLDTSETYNVETLDFWTEELTKVFGEPKETGSEDEDHTWEWKVEVDGDIYSIYNWNEYGESYEDATWYLGSTVENKKTIKVLNDYIWSLLDKEEVKDSSPSMEELFGEDSDDEDLEIDLDGIDEM